MRLLSQFNRRMKQIYESSSQGAPLPFAKVAKAACKEIGREAVRLNGVSTSPNLMTILVHPSDEQRIRPYYEQTTTEISYCLTQHARNRSLAVTQDPLVRFISHHTMKPGSFFCCAQSVPYSIMSQLEKEENQIIKGKKRTNVGQGAASTPRVDPSFDADSELIVPVLEGVPDLPSPPPPVVPPLTGLSTANNVSLGGTNYQARRYAQEPAEFALEQQGSFTKHQLHEDSYILGRDRSVATITFKDSNVSRAHAKIYKDHDVFVLEDLGSTNGVYLNGTRINDPVELRVGDEIVLGATTLQFVRG